MLELDRFLPYRLSVLSNRISAAIARDYAERFDLSVTEWRVLAILGRASGASASEVAERAAMDKVAVSRAVASLLASGRLRRGRHAGDRRRSVLALSARGRRVYQQIVPIALAHQQRLIDALGARDHAALERILGKLATAASAPAVG